MIAQNTTNKPLSDRQEKFCQIKANEDVSHSEAYRRAGYSPVGADRNSSRLMVKDDIKARIADIRAEKAVELAVTRELQTERYTDVARRCRDLGDITNEIRAYNGIDKLHGLAIDKTETTETVPEATAEQLEEFRRISQEILYRKHLAQDNTLAGCMSGCRESDNSGPLSQKQG